MKRTVMLGANLMAGMMDFGVGSLIAAVILNLFSMDVTLFGLFIGGLLALLPDFDIVPSILFNRVIELDHHTTFFHKPIVLLPITAIAAYILGGIVWVWIGICCVGYHYLHDTGLKKNGSGITWLWPFSDKALGWYGLYTLEIELPHHVWLQKYWLQPSKKSVYEVSLGAVCLGIALFSTTTYAATYLVLPATMLAISIGVWSVSRLLAIKL